VTHALRTIWLLTSLLVVTAWGAAQAAPNLTGEWKLNKAKSNYGPVPAPDSMTRTVIHSDPLLHISTHQKGAQGEATTELTYSTNGKPAVNQLQGGTATGTAKWQGDTLVIESSREMQGIKVQSKEVWALSADGKVLTIGNHVSIPQQGEYDVKLVFDKQ
jgi:hypothetical protein